MVVERSEFRTQYEAERCTLYGTWYKELEYVPKWRCFGKWPCPTLGFSALKKEGKCDHSVRKYNYILSWIWSVPILLVRCVQTVFMEELLRKTKNQERVSLRSVRMIGENSNTWTFACDDYFESCGLSEMSNDTVFIKRVMLRMLPEHFATLWRLQKLDKTSLLFVLLFNEGLGWEQLCHFGRLYSSEKSFDLLL